ncbi:unnamed protein product [Ranitomeya imitator]|uniref:IF rod domain-containing protein n=1 Tax=Ranitomeya imitator TaxID=111125 RepID=A0ABN9MKQ5_9NEOB|nr:unnamed protein product [Ranitomeya imitator]
MERNLKEVESIFLARSAELNREVSSGAEQLQSFSSELIDLKRSVQTLEIDLLSQLSMKSALENTLAETKATFGTQLAQLQEMIDNIESQLGQMRSDLERQNYEYKILKDQKTLLEMEITTYKQLLDGNDIQFPAHHSTEHKDMKCYMKSLKPEACKSMMSKRWKQMDSIIVKIIGLLGYVEARRPEEEPKKLLIK